MGGWLPQVKADPITDDAKTFYVENKKQLKQSVPLGKKHDELQREAWTDKIFTADNVYTTAKAAQEAGKRNSELGKQHRDQSE